MGFTLEPRCSGLNITLHKPQKHHTSDRLFCDPLRWRSPRRGGLRQRAIDSLQLSNVSEYFWRYDVLGLMMYGLWHIPHRRRILETTADLRCFEVQVGSIRRSPLKSKI